MFIPLLSSNENSSHSFIVAGYYENYSQFRPPSGNRQPFSIKMIDTNIVLEIYYAFAAFGYVSKAVDPTKPHATGNFKIEPTQKNDQTVLYPQLQSLKNNSQNKLKTILSIGGWNFNDPEDPEGTGKYTYLNFSQMVSSKSSRKEFIESAIEYALQYGFNGIDIDWEYPGDSSRGGKPEDFVNFIDFLKECSFAFSKTTPRLVLSCAFPASIPAGLPKSYHENPDSYFKWVAQCAQYLDSLTVMAYDYHGPFDIPKITGANAPLMRDTDEKSIYFIAKTLQNLLSQGVPAKKLMLGIPTFGHSYAGVPIDTPENTGPGKLFVAAGPPGTSTQKSGLLSYYEISDKIAQRRLDFGNDHITNTAYGYNLLSKEWVSFDTPETVKLKAKLAKDLNLRGVIFWSIDMDEYQWEPRYPNIRSANNVLKNNPAL